MRTILLILALLLVPLTAHASGVNIALAESTNSNIWVGGHKGSGKIRDQLRPRTSTTRRPWARRSAAARDWLGRSRRSLSAP